MKQKLASISNNELANLVTTFLDNLVQILPRESKTNPPKPLGSQKNITWKRKTAGQVLEAIDKVVKTCEKTSLQDLVKLEMDHEAKKEQAKGTVMCNPLQRQSLSIN